MPEMRVSQAQCVRVESPGLIIHRLQLKGDTYNAADDDDAFWEILEQIDEMQTLVV